MFGVIAPPLNASVRLPAVVPNLEVGARMKSANAVPLRFRGPTAAAVQVTRSGVQAVTVLATSGPVTKSCSSSGRQPRGLARPGGSSGSSIRVGGVCRCRRGPAARTLHLRRQASFESNPSSALGLYARVPSAYGVRIMRQPNYALERTAKPPRKYRRHHAAAQRER